MEQLKKQFRKCLEENILKYWIEQVTDQQNGGYYGRIDGHNIIHPEAEKGAVMNARILWAFAAAYRVLGKPEYLAAAQRARDYFLEKFLDRKHGGVFWSVDYKGMPLDTKKQTYAIGFAIYALSEYARAIGDNETLTKAIELFHDIENHARQADGGYIEALTQDWQPIADMRLSDKDENLERTMNTHLHIIEPYTNLLRTLRSWTKNAILEQIEHEVEQAVRNLLELFTNRILNPDTGHLDLFFNQQWKSKRNLQSFGHDIEASWLLHESALVLADPTELKRIEPIIQKIAKAADEGLQQDGSMIYELNTNTGYADRQRQWWVQCESVIGHANLYEHFGDARALGDAIRCWEFIRQKLIDREHGEWHWAVLANGTLDREGDKAGFWKCPYHNARMCIEIMERNI